jgi:hypothetical protein
MKRHLFWAAALLATTTAGQASDTIYSPAEAIALAKSTSAGRSGRFEMVVASTGKTPNGTFLNSTADYRGDDNLTFRLRPIVADILAKRYGAPMDVFLKGKHVVVDGKVVDRPIANMVVGRARSLNRYQHEVDVDVAAQLVGVNG